VILLSAYFLFPPLRAMYSAVLDTVWVMTVTWSKEKLAGGEKWKTLNSEWLEFNFEECFLALL